MRDPGRDQRDGFRAGLTMIVAGEGLASRAAVRGAGMGCAPCDAAGDSVEHSEDIRDEGYPAQICLIYHIFGC